VIKIACEYGELKPLCRKNCGAANHAYLSHMAVKSRFCRVCGEPFQAKRFDALTCTGTCRMRKARGADLAYLAALPSYLAEVRRSVHEADLDAIATVRAATASKHEGRRQRRQLPKGSRIRTVAPGARPEPTE
jgi:hypothetical protein